MIFELIQSDYYEELGKTNFAKDLREESFEDLDCDYEYNYGGVGGNNEGNYVGDGVIFTHKVGYANGIGGIYHFTGIIHVGDGHCDPLVVNELNL
jgi:hypothetical protein